MTESIYSKYNIDPNKLSRDYINNPIHISPNGIDSEKPTKEDFYYLYIELNLTYNTLCNIFNVKRGVIECWNKKYGIRKTKSSINKNINETNLERYGVTSTNVLDWKKDKIKKSNLLKNGDENYNNRDKTKVTCLKKYGVNNISQVPIIKAKKKDSYLKKYGVKHYFHTDEYKNNYNNKEWVKNIQHKIYNTKKKNNSFTKSKPEDKHYELLCNQFGKDNVIRQYNTELYPFNCDFYIKSTDTYIEYNGNWTHGKEPYDPDNKSHQKLLEKWKSKSNGKDYYSYAIKYWTISDPLKRKTAQKNGLNFIEVWS